MIKYCFMAVFLVVVIAYSAAAGGGLDMPQQMQIVQHEVESPWWTENSFIALMGMLATCVPAYLGYRQYKKNRGS